MTDTRDAYDAEPRSPRLIDVLGVPSDEQLLRIIALLRLAEPRRSTVKPAGDAA